MNLNLGFNCKPKSLNQLGADNCLDARALALADDPPKPTSRPKPKSKDVRKAPESVSDPVAMEVSTKAQRQAKRARPAEELEPLSASASKAMGNALTA